MDQFIKRGLITVAMGDYYCYMAENLYRSYKIYDNHYPFYVLCDNNSAERLSSIFDGTIVVEDPYYNLMDKISIYEKSVFEETIYIDSDCFVTGDISFLFDEFEKNNSDISCLGQFDFLDDRSKFKYSYNYFTEKTIQKYGLDRYIFFTGGMYFFKKTKKAEEMMSLCKNVFVPYYDEEGLSRHGPRKSDECVIGTAMLIYGMKPLYLDNEHIMSYVYRPKGEWNSDLFNPKSVRWNLKSNSFYIKEGENKFYILIPHWMTPLTKNIIYYNFHLKIKCLYERKSKFFMVACVVFCDFLYFIKRTKGQLCRLLKKITKKGNE